jgi:hypothetical protein
MKKIIGISLLVFILGCGAVASKTYLPSGEEGYTISCSANYQTWGHCYQKAGNLCRNRGYDIIMKSDDDKGAEVYASQHALYGSTTNKRSMIIKCK